ncbi:MAG: hypothetical protein GY895_03210 [Phycisphaera sp.]|nr:hypothetical protein [Phycisphaera sp.]
MDQNDSIAEEIARIQKLLGSRLMNMVEERVIPLMEAHPDRPDVARLHAECLMEWGDHRQAAIILEKQRESFPDEPQLLKGLINCYASLALTDELVETSGQLLKMGPNRPDAMGPCVDALERAGQYDAAEEMLERLEALPPAILGAMPKVRIPYLKARILMGRKKPEEASRVLSDTVKKMDPDSLSDSDQKQYHECLFLLSKSLDKIKDYDGAWKAAEMAHANEGSPFNVEGYEKTLENMRRVFSPEMASKLARADAVESEPLIILGNPRSGTTLLDTILGMHSEVAQGGELSAGRFVQQALSRLTDSYLPFPMSLADLRVEDANALGRIYEECTAGLANGQRYLSNKALSMHIQLGMLTLALPRMRVINLHRHPLDNCVSCYLMNLLVSGHNYTNDLEWLGRTWVARRKMQEYWPTVLDVPILELHYEDMVGDQENQTRRILDFLDVPFDDACLNFHEAEKTAATLSYDQVSQKMYTTSRGRWRHYEKHLGPLIDIVQPYL